MSVAMTNCGEAGWLTDRPAIATIATTRDRSPWPAMPGCFRALASDAAEQAGYPGFAPDACLINRYEPGTRLTPHQDKDERDYAHPIVSVSLGLPATFQFGGPKRSDPCGSSRSGTAMSSCGARSVAPYHGIAELKDGKHVLLGRAHQPDVPPRVIKKISVCE